MKRLRTLTIALAAAPGMIGAVSLLAPSVAHAQVADCSRCASEKTCPLDSTDQLECWTNLFIKSGRSCREAVSRAGPISDESADAIRKAFRSHTAAADCSEQFVLNRGALLTSIWVSSTDSGLFGQKHALQVIPNFSIGIPIRLTSRSSATEALRGSATFGGIVLRYTPASYWFAFQALLGSADPSPRNLSADAFPAPKLLAAGAGVSILGNLLNASILCAWLYDNGFLSTVADSTSYINLTLDFTAIGISALGIVK